jgi:cytochrome c556
MNKLVLMSVLATAIVSAALAHEGHEHATGVVRERMELMTEMGKRLLASSKRLRANRDLEGVTSDARAIQSLALKMTALFPPGSTQSPTAAKPAVWQDWDDFSARARDLEKESEKLVNTSPKDGAALRAQFRAVAFACDACHEKYRVTKETRH